MLIWPSAMAAQPTNDNFSDATLIASETGSLTQSTAGATKEFGEPNHGGDTGGASVWFTWEAPADGAAEFDLHLSDFDTALSAYTGATLDNLTAVAQNDDAVNYSPLVSQWIVRETQSHIRFPTRTGVRYSIAVDGVAGITGAIQLGWKLKPRPANDSFASALVLSGMEGFIATHNVGATKEPGEPNHATNAGSASIWFRWTAPATGPTRFYTLNSLTSLAGPLDTLLGIYTGEQVDALTQVAANDNSGTSVRSLVQFTATAGITYHIAVDAKAAPTNHGEILLTWVNGVPTNNNFSTATHLTGNCGRVQGHNTSATKEAGEPTITGNAGGSSIWYSWTAPTDGEAMFTTAGSPFLDTLLAVYRGGAVNSLSVEAENDDVIGGYLDDLGYSRVEFTAVAGRTYKIAVDGYRSGSAAATGVTFLQWAFQPATNDDFINAETISGTNGTVTACNAFALAEDGEPNHAGNAGGHSIWYRWEAPATGLGAIDLEGSSFDTLLAVYRDDATTLLDQLTLVAQNNDWYDGFNLHFHSRVEFTATQGATYYIAVDGAADNTGYISDGWVAMRYDIAPPPSLAFTRSGQDVVIHWDGPYTLESAPTLDSLEPPVWTPVPGLPPITIPISAFENRYFRAAHP